MPILIDVGVKISYKWAIKRRVERDTPSRHGPHEWMWNARQKDVLVTAARQQATRMTDLGVRRARLQRDSAESLSTERTDGIVTIQRTQGWALISLQQKSFGVRNPRFPQ